MSRLLRTPADLRMPRGLASCQVMILRESPTGAEAPVGQPGEAFPMGDTPERIADLFKSVVAGEPDWDWERETMVAFLISTRRRVQAWQRLATGTLDTLLVHPRDVFRLAIVANAAAVVVAHNHPSGDATPSEADVKVTRDLIRAGQLLRIEVLDHIIVGHPAQAIGRGWTSLKELGYFYNS